nr:PREDICTED: histamine H2 receptor isoform X2 [Anolis carolinensis]|eukprot:XP_016852855.1 PREDICTED: histamine H2 receptor isoform X2 [Anolis carolinensis]
MAHYKPKGEKETKDLKTQPRRSSIPEDMNLRDMMRDMMKEVYRMQEKQDILQKMVQEQMSDMRKEWKEDLGEMKKEMNQIQEDLRELRSEKKELRKIQETTQKEIKEILERNRKMERKQEELEAKEMEFQLRLRNIVEEPREDIRLTVVEILSNLLGCTEREMEEQMDRTYRVNTIYAKKNKTPRDVIVHLTRKVIRDEILKINNRKQIYFKEKKVAILKEQPSSVINRRRKYTPLTDELKKRKIKFKWEREEGLMATFRERKYWITTEEGAKEFLRKIKSEKGKDREEEEHENNEREKKKKRLREFSPDKEEMDLGNYRLNLRGNTEIANLDRVKETQEESMERVEEEEEKEEKEEENQKEEGQC